MAHLAGVPYVQVGVEVGLQQLFQRGTEFEAAFAELLRPHAPIHASATAYGEHLALQAFAVAVRIGADAVPGHQCGVGQERLRMRRPDHPVVPADVLPAFIKLPSGTHHVALVGGGDTGVVGAAVGIEPSTGRYSVLGVALELERSPFGRAEAAFLSVGMAPEGVDMAGVDGQVLAFVALDQVFVDRDVFVPVGLVDVHAQRAAALPRGIHEQVDVP